MQAVLTSDSPALVGSNITFVVNLVFPRCQKEDANGNIVYEKNCRNEAGLSADPYVYNWTAWSEDSDGENGTGQSHHNVFPDGKPFLTTPDGEDGISSTSSTHLVSISRNWDDVQ